MSSPPARQRTRPALPPTARGRRVEVRLGYRPLWSVARVLIGREPGVVLLDSGDGSAPARWSFLGWHPRRVISWPQGRAGAFDRLRECLDDPALCEDQPGEVPFCSGWLGWFSYDLGRHTEQLPSRARTDPTIPDFVLGEYDMVLAEDHATETLWAAGRCPPGASEHRVRARAEWALALSERYVGTAAAPPQGPSTGGHPVAAGAKRPPQGLMPQAVYRSKVEAILDHIRNGSLYQANLSHRFATRTAAPSSRLYGLLRQESPAAFACYMGLPGAPEVLSASPELLVRKTGARLRTCPIKGTRPRGADPATDARLRDELNASEKERAELLMITDLLRNDLGRVAAYGSVKVEKLRALQSHATVHHAHSEISARLRRGLGVTDVLAATIPGGSVTGAPKIRAMEVLDELEPIRRGPYTGAAGFIGHDGDVCLNILIRTLVRRGSDVWYQVGGGIVADSDPEAEYEETLAKGAAMRRALIHAG